MRVHSTRYAAIALLMGGLACAGNKARTADTDQAAAARDTTRETRDTVGGEAQNPPGYRGMERDTTLAPPAQQTPTDTFLQQQGQGQPQDTAGYSGMERVDTTGAAGVLDTSGALGPDTTGINRTDTTGYNPSQQPSQDTTGQNPSQDTTSARY